MLAESAVTGCTAAWYTGSGACNSVCSGQGKTCQSGGMQFSYTLERSTKVLSTLGTLGNCARWGASTPDLAHPYGHGNVFTQFWLHTCGACRRTCHTLSNPPPSDDGSGNPVFYSSTVTNNDRYGCSGSHWDARKFCVCG